jgi:hypothetical protein
MRSVKLVFALIKVRVLRLNLLVFSLAKVLSLGLPFRFGTFPFLKFLNYETLPPLKSATECILKLNTHVDVVISLYKFYKYIPVLERSLQSCFLNPRITFHFVLVSGDTSERNWLLGLVNDTHHKVYQIENRIGIYSAWNIAIEGGSGELITNLNADDLRLPHSICCQALALQEESHDGSYGNFILSTDIFSSLENKSHKALVSDLGNFSEAVLVNQSQNMMHCAPMWKRTLHNRFGMFDESLKSSGDTEFWLRAMAGGAKFSSYTPVTAIYFHNPEGLSSSLSSSGHREWQSVRDSHLRRKHNIPLV